MKKEELSQFPMGPKLREWLQLDASYAGDTTPLETPEHKTLFSTSVLEELKINPILEDQDFVSIIDEVVAMDFPELALQIADSNVALPHRKYFRGVLAEAIAAMLAHELERAKECFRLAQELSPEEPASYVNMARILLHESKTGEAMEWCLGGLDAEVNNFNLWELIHTIIATPNEEQTYLKLLNLAQEKNSWAGFSLAAEVSPHANSQTKKELLEDIYHEGERSHDFLIEYTGALGMAGQFEKIPPIIFQVKKFSSETLPWKLQLHLAQAFLAMEQKEQFDEAASQLLSKSEVPMQVKAELEELIKGEKSE